MSTQRRANRTTAAIEVDRVGVWYGWFRGCMERAGTSISVARTGSLLASVITAPLMSIIWLAWAWLRTCDEGSRAINLQGGHKLSVFGLLFRNVCRTWKPFRFAAPRWGRRTAGCRSRRPRTGHPLRTFPSSPSARISTPPCRRPQQAKSAGRKGTMAKEICISSTPHETRLAILEDDQLAEIYYERENEYTLAGSIYNGRVTRVLPGMQSAFVDVGLERDAFLYVTDFMELEDQEETDELEKAAVSGANQAPREVRHTNGQDRGRARSWWTGSQRNAKGGLNSARSARAVRQSKSPRNPTTRISRLQVKQQSNPMTAGIRRGWRKTLARTPSPSRRPRRQQCFGNSGGEPGVYRDPCERSRLSPNRNAQTRSRHRPHQQGMRDLSAASGLNGLNVHPSPLFCRANRLGNMVGAAAESAEKSAT